MFSLKNVYYNLGIEYESLTIIFIFNHVDTKTLRRIIDLILINKIQTLTKKYANTDSPELAFLFIYIYFSIIYNKNKIVVLK